MRSLWKLNSDNLHVLSLFIIQWLGQFKQMAHLTSLQHMKIRTWLALGRCHPTKDGCRRKIIYLYSDFLNIPLYMYNGNTLVSAYLHKLFCKACVCQYSSYLTSATQVRTRKGVGEGHTAFKTENWKRPGLTNCKRKLLITRPQL